jgi:hypothetical protein
LAGRRGQPTPAKYGLIGTEDIDVILSLLDT